MTDERTVTTDERREGKADFSAKSPTVAIAEALADHNGSDPADPLGDGTMLYDHIDIEALERLLSSPRAADVTVTFSLGRYRVSVREDGRVDVQSR